MDLSVIIVNWNVKDRLRENLKALYQSEGAFHYEVFVVDNNSEDGSADMVEKEFPRARLLRNEYNVGFAKANNQAIEKSQGDFILLLNPDMQVRQNTLFKMLVWMKANPRANVAGCHLVDEEGATVEHIRRWPSLINQLAIVLKLPHFLPFVLNKYLFKNFDYKKEARVNSVRGGFFFVNACKDNRVPLWLDEQYFVWFEEVDFCKQIYKQGGEVWYTPVTECVDYVGQSFKQISRGLAQSYFRASMLKYFKKWHPKWQFYTIWLAWWPGLFIAWLGVKIRYKHKAKN